MPWLRCAFGNVSFNKQFNFWQGYFPYLPFTNGRDICFCNRLPCKVSRNVVTCFRAGQWQCSNWPEQCTEQILVLLHRMKLKLKNSNWIICTCRSYRMIVFLWWYCSVWAALRPQASGQDRPWKFLCNQSWPSFHPSETFSWPPFHLHET